MEEVIIVGAGLAGLGCAKRLHENDQKFRIITENIGGRVKTSHDGKVNYGAYYMTKDCHNIIPYIEKVMKVRFGHSHFHDGNKHYHIYSLILLKHLPALIKLGKDLYEFRRHLIKLRKESLEHSRKELIEADPLLREYYHQRAAVYIKKRGLEKLVREYLEQPLWASFFTDPRSVPTALFLGSLQPLIVKSYSFVFHFEKLIQEFKKDIVFDLVIRVIRKNEYWELITKSGKVWRCKKLVIATPMNITNKLVKPQKIKGSVNVSFYHLRGEIREPYNTKWYNFFSVKEATAISREPNGSYLYFYSGKDKIKKYFKKWEVIAHKKWKPALFFLGDEYINENPESNLFIASDHNVPGMEDAFITGKYVGKLLGSSIKV